MQKIHVLALLATTTALSACATDRIGDRPNGRWAPLGGAVEQNVAVQADGVHGVLRDLEASFRAETEEMVTFAFDSARLDGAARAAIDTQVAWLQRHPGVRMSVIGHADRVGPEDYNYRLGLARAKAVVDYMATRGISPARLDQLASRGENDPLVETLGPERLNRRVVTTVAPLGRQFPGFGMDGRRALAIYRGYLERPVVGGVQVTGGAAAGGAE